MATNLDNSLHEDSDDKEAQEALKAAAGAVAATSLALNSLQKKKG